MTLVYELPNRELLIIDSEVVCYLSRKKQKRFQFERGGILFAHFEEGKTIVSLATGPYKKDLQRPFQYQPHKKSAQNDIESKFKEGLHYIGEWHTHPQKIPRPSQQDLNTLQHCYRRSKHILNFMVLIIVGQNQFPEGLWVGVSNGLKMYALKERFIEGY